MTQPHAPRLGQGFCWEDLKEGQMFQTFRRTITETDLVGFISVTGMLESLYIDAAHHNAGAMGRPVPAALSCALMEGFLSQSMLQGTGLGLVEAHHQVLESVMLGDTIWALVTVTGIRPTARSGRAIVDLGLEIFNQRSEKVIICNTRRMLAGHQS